MSAGYAQHARVSAGVAESHGHPPGPHHHGSAGLNLELQPLSQGAELRASDVATFCRACWALPGARQRTGDILKSVPSQMETLYTNGTASLNSFVSFPFFLSFCSHSLLWLCRCFTGRLPRCAAGRHDMYGAITAVRWGDSGRHVWIAVRPPPVSPSKFLVFTN